MYYQYSMDALEIIYPWFQIIYPGEPEPAPPKQKVIIYLDNKTFWLMDWKIIGFNVSCFAE